MIATASIWSACLAALMLRMTAARASVSARLTPASVSLASAASSAGSAAASRDRNTACAASKRFAGSGASKVSDPSAASIARRSRLLIRTSFRSEIVSPAMSDPAAAFLGDGIVIAALEGLPVADEVLGALEIFRPGVARDQAFGLPDHVKLPIRAHLADVDRLGDVVVGQHLGGAAGQVRRIDADDGVADLVRLGDASLLLP